MSQILNGKLVAKKLKNETKEQVEAFKRSYHRYPKLVVLLIGDNAASTVYVKNKEKACQAVGIQSECFFFPESVSTQELISTIQALNKNETVDGILVQLPLPPHIPSYRILTSISPLKDVDCFHPENVGKLWQGTSIIAPCTPAGIMQILDHYGIGLQGKHAVIIGRSTIVGKPLACLFLQRDATTTIAHSKSNSLKDVAKQGDILVTAIGKPGFITKDYIKNDAIVVDVGINRISKSDARPSWTENEKFMSRFTKKNIILIGDVDPIDVLAISSYYTPVPGGVGPMTVAMLLKNTLVLAYEHEKNRKTK